MAEPSPHLPHDVLFSGILSKLPVKSLYRFKSVSKLWNATISSDSHFIKSHLSWTKQNSISSMLGIFRNIVDRDPRDCEYIFVKEDCTVLFRFQTRNLYLSVVHCNGLFCFHSEFGFHICNPHTRDLLYLPSPLPTKTKHTSYGFGFDTFENVYKLVQIVHASRNDYGCMIYTLGGSSDNSWKDITIASRLSIQLNRCTLPHLDKLGRTVRGGRGLYINGKFNWYFRCSGMFLVFDVHHEKFEYFDGPGPEKSLRAKFRIISDLFIKDLFIQMRELQGCVCLAFDNCTDETHLYEYEMHRDWKLLKVNTEGDWTAYGSSGGKGLSHPLVDYIELFAPEGQDGLFIYNHSSKMAKRFLLQVGLDCPETPYGLSDVACTVVHHFENIVPLKTTVESVATL